VDLQLPSGLTVRGRMTKEEYAQLGLADDQEVSFHIRQYRVLGHEGTMLSPEISTPCDLHPSLGENI
jgi:hypothetical protein